MPPADARQSVELGPPAKLACFPFRRNPTSQLQLVQRGVERSVADLERFPGHLFQPLANCPTMHWGQRQNLQDQKIQRPLHEIRRFTQNGCPRLPRSYLSCHRLHKSCAARASASRPDHGLTITPAELKANPTPYELVLANQSTD